MPGPPAANLPALNIASEVGHPRQTPPTSQSPNNPGITVFARNSTGWGPGRAAPTEHLWFSPQRAAVQTPHRQTPARSASGWDELTAGGVRPHQPWLISLEEHLFSTSLLCSYRCWAAGINKSYSSFTYNNLILVSSSWSSYGVMMSCI